MASSELTKRLDKLLKRPNATLLHQLEGIISHLQMSNQAGGILTELESCHVLDTKTPEESVRRLIETLKTKDDNEALFLSLRKHGFLEMADYLEGAERIPKDSSTYHNAPGSKLTAIDDNTALVGIRSPTESDQTQTQDLESDKKLKSAFNMAAKYKHKDKDTVTPQTTATKFVDLEKEIFTMDTTILSYVQMSKKLDIPLKNLKPYDRDIQKHPMSKNSSTSSEIQVGGHRARRHSTMPVSTCSDETETDDLIQEIKPRYQRSKSVPDDFTDSQPYRHCLPWEAKLLLKIPSLLDERGKHWDDFGRMLGIKESVLTKIRNKYVDNDHRCVVMLEQLSKKMKTPVRLILEKQLKDSPDVWSRELWLEIWREHEELKDLKPKLDLRALKLSREHLPGTPSEHLLQTLSSSDAISAIYWQIGRLLGLPTDAIDHIEASFHENALNKKTLQVFRKWKKEIGGTLQCLLQELQYLEVDLRPFTKILSSPLSIEYVRDCRVNDQFAELQITTAVLTATQSEYNTVLEYFEEIQPQIKCGEYLCRNDPSLEGSPPVARTLNVNELNLEHVERLLLVSFPAFSKEFVVYQPKASQAIKATPEMVSLAKEKRWPLKYFYIIGYCSYYSKEPRGALGQIMLVDCLDDYNQGDVTDDQFKVVSNPHEMSQDLFQIVSFWAYNGPKLEWNVPFEKAKRVCSAPRNVKSKKVASNLLIDDSCIAIETEGVRMLTVKDVVDVLQKSEPRGQIEYVVVKGAAHLADVPNERTQPMRLFNQDPQEYGALEREAIATLHSIVLVTRCIVFDKQRFTDV